MKNLIIKNYLLNSIQTPDGTILTSTHRHDYKTYKDKNGEEYMVDGGNSYLRRNINIEPYIDLSIIDDGSHELRRQYLTWGSNYDKDMNRLPETIYNPIKDMTSDHIQAILDGGWAKNNPFYEELFKEELKFRIKESV
jgi:hypothetical protein